MATKGRAKSKGNKICPAGIAWAKRTFDKYPSAYANMAAKVNTARTPTTPSFKAKK